MFSSLYSKHWNCKSWVSTFELEFGGILFPFLYFIIIYISLFIYAMNKYLESSGSWVRIIFFFIFKHIFWLEIFIHYVELLGYLCKKEFSDLIVLSVKGQIFVWKQGNTEVPIDRGNQKEKRHIVEERECYLIINIASTD